jgi:hypothetical protein
VSFGDPEIEVLSADVNGNIVEGNVRIALQCGDCGQDLKDAELEFSIEILHECKPEALAAAKKAKTADALDGENGEFELVEDCTAEPVDRFADKDRHGKKIKSMRYMKHFYGAEVMAEVKCCKCGEVFTVSDTVEESASGFNELV